MEDADAMATHDENLPSSSTGKSAQTELKEVVIAKLGKELEKEARKEEAKVEEEGGEGKGGGGGGETGGQGRVQSEGQGEEEEKKAAGEEEGEGEGEGEEEEAEEMVDNEGNGIRGFKMNVNFKDTRLGPLHEKKKYRTKVLKGYISAIF